jgi:6-phospho 3-hexuloisomerase
MHVADHLVSMIATSIKKVEEHQVQQLSDAISRAKRSIFITGSGRSLLVGKFFAMRLMHLGKSVHIVGGLCTPSIQKGDVLIALSGSCNTSSAINICKTAKKFGAMIILITQNDDSTLAEIADLSLIIHADNTMSYTSYAPMGTLFETSALIFLESFIGRYMLQHRITENQLKRRHANLE